jgi:hypothetical protein
MEKGSMRVAAEINWLTLPVHLETVGPAGE